MASGQQKEFVTLGGVPLRFAIEWPFHRSTSGADWHVIHGRATLLSDATLGADFAANFTETVVEALPSLEPEHAGPVIINAVRVWVDAGRMEFLKSGKRLPVEVSSRYLNLKTNAIRFLTASDDELKKFLLTKIYWLSFDRQNAAQQNARVQIADGFETQYLGSSSEKLLSAANELAAEELCEVDNEFVIATAKMAEHAGEMKDKLQKTLDRAVAKFNQALIG